MVVDFDNFLVILAAELLDEEFPLYATIAVNQLDVKDMMNVYGRAKSSAKLILLSIRRNIPSSSPAASRFISIFP